MERICVCVLWCMYVLCMCLVVYVCVVYVCCCVCDLYLPVKAEGARADPSEVRDK